jgi:hypothetical protein
MGWSSCYGVISATKLNTGGLASDRSPAPTTCRPMPGRPWSVIANSPTEARPSSMSPSVPQTVISHGETDTERVAAAPSSILDGLGDLSRKAGRSFGPDRLGRSESGDPTAPAIGRVRNARGSAIVASLMATIRPSRIARQVSLTRYGVGGPSRAGLSRSAAQPRPDW